MKTILVCAYATCSFPLYSVNYKIISSGKEVLTLQAVFERIENSTSYTIAYNHSEIDVRKKVTIPEGESSLDQLLTSVLKNTGCTYLIHEKHIIITATRRGFVDNILPEKPNISPENREIIRYKGIVLNADTRQPMASAVINLIDNNNVLNFGATNELGEFSLLAPSSVETIKITHVGYKTVYKDLPAVRTDLGYFFMEEDAVILPELILSTEAWRNVDRYNHIITPEMCIGISTAQELLDRMHGMRLDKVGNALRAGNESSVLLLVDGMRQSQEYIKGIAPERISRIEILNEPSGNYLAENYSLIVNLILKKDYTGTDIALSYNGIINPVGTNGSYWLANNQPAFQFSSTRNNVNIYGTYYYGKDLWKMPVSKKLAFEGMEYISENNSLKNPNSRHEQSTSNVTAGVNYQINPAHTWSVQADYMYNDIATEETFNMTSGRATNGHLFPYTSLKAFEDNDYTLSLFYKGWLTDNFQLYSDISYNYYFNKQRNTTKWQPSFIRSYDEDKEQLVFDVEGMYDFGRDFSINFGYSRIIKKYNSSDSLETTFLKYNESRDKWFSYFSFSASDKIKFKLGTAVEYTDLENKSPSPIEEGRPPDVETQNHFWRIQPYAKINYAVSKDVNINLSYVTNNQYPSLYQLNPVFTQNDPFTYQAGNANLKNAVRHTASVRLTLWERLSFAPIFKYVPDMISDFYAVIRNVPDENFYYRTFENVNMKQYEMQVVYDQPLGKYFNLKGAFTYYQREARYKGHTNSLDGWLLDSEVNYLNPDLDLKISLGYYRAMDENILLQGSQMINMDNWVINFNKLFSKKRVSLDISYIPPISWGIRTNQLKEIHTLHYTELTKQSIKTYQNMIFVKLAILLRTGEVKRTDRESNIERETREKRIITF